MKMKETISWEIYDQITKDGVDDVSNQHKYAELNDIEKSQDTVIVCNKTLNVDGSLQLSFVAIFSELAASLLSALR